VSAQVVALASIQKRNSKHVKPSNEDARILIDSGGFILKVDPAFIRYFGYSDTELIGHHFQEIVRLGDYITTHLAFEMKSESYAVRVDCKDGSRVSSLFHSSSFETHEERYRILRVRPMRPSGSAEIIQLR
jgi:PAS domain S-box-containing protein